MISIGHIISTSRDKLNRLVATMRINGLVSNGQGDVRTPVQTGPFGFESNPIKKKVGLYVKSGHDGKYYMVATINTDCITEPGESRMFSTDDDGQVQMSLLMKKDGTAEFGGDDDNLVRFIPAKDGFNELREDLNDLITKFNAHIHPTTTPGAPTSVPTGPPATTSTASINDAKIDEIKTSG